MSTAFQQSTIKYMFIVILSFFCQCPLFNKKFWDINLVKCMCSVLVLIQNGRLLLFQMKLIKKEPGSPKNNRSRSIFLSTLYRNDEGSGVGLLPHICPAGGKSVIQLLAWKQTGISIPSNEICMFLK